MPNEPIDPRVILAAERTLLAWVRTGLAMMGFGFVVARFGLFLREMSDAGHAPSPRQVHASQVVGITLILLGVGVHLLAGVQHARLIVRLKAGLPLEPKVVSTGTILSIILAAMGVALAVYLMSV